MTGPPLGIRYSGVGLAILAFLETQLLVASALEPDAVSFMVAGVVPLVAGLALTLYGVVLAVGGFSRVYARSVWVGAVLGTLATVAVLTTTAVHTILVGDGLEPLLGSGVLVGNVVLGGTIAGAVVGDRSARGRNRRNELARYAERAMLVNRLLRHEVMNAATIVKGYADRLGSGDAGDSAAVIRSSATDIEERVEQIAEFAASDAAQSTVRVVPVLERVCAEYADDRSAVAANGTGSPQTSTTDGPAADTRNAEQPPPVESDATEPTDDDAERAPADSAAGGTADSGSGTTPIETRFSLPPDALVLADRRLELLVRELLENALEHAGDDAHVELRAEADARSVTLHVSDDGPGLPDAARSLLTSPGLPEVDDPRYGYGLQMVRLLVDHYGGSVAIDESDGTTISVTLPRPLDEKRTASAVGVPTGALYRSGIAATAAGIVLGLSLELVAGSVTTIGPLYGVESRVVGWITHLFHSLLFGVCFAALIETRIGRAHAATDGRRAIAGAIWGGALWTVAATVVVPLWLLAVNADSQLPAVGLVGLPLHLLWGALLGWLYGALDDPPGLGAVTGWLRG